MTKAETAVLAMIVGRITHLARQAGAVEPMFVEDSDDADSVLIVDAKTGRRYQIRVEPLETTRKM